MAIHLSIDFMFIHISSLGMYLRESSQHGGGADRGGEKSFTEDGGWKLQECLGSVALMAVAVVRKRSIVAL